MQTSLDLGKDDAAGKRATALSDRACMVIGAAASTLDGCAPIYRYKGYIGFRVGVNHYVYIGNGGGLRSNRTEQVNGGSPRCNHAASPVLVDRLVRIGRRLVANQDVQPSTYGLLIAVKRRHLGRGLDAVAACLELRRVLDRFLTS